MRKNKKIFKKLLKEEKWTYDIFAKEVNEYNYEKRKNEWNIYKYCFDTVNNYNSQRQFHQQRLFISKKRDLIFKNGICIPSQPRNIVNKFGIVEGIFLYIIN